LNPARHLPVAMTRPEPGRKGFAMKYGVVYFPTDYSIRVDDMARAVEDRGFESLWLPEHTHIPCSRRSPYPLGGELPREYIDGYELLTGMAVAAVVTKKIMIGSSICLVVERDPIVLAKELATIDKLSGGRIQLGIGSGWNAEEMENHGIQWKDRRGVMREKVAAMKTIWTSEKSEYHGKYVNFDPIWCNPKPVQKPHVPILMGGNGSIAIKYAARQCDGWLPSAVLVDQLSASMQQLRAELEQAGRDPKSFPTTVLFAPHDRKQLDQMEAMGIDRAVFAIPSAERDKAASLLDRRAKVAGF
jgi:probable F420-dependent oxidoreductase